MILAPGPVADPAAPLARRNPVAKVGAGLLLVVPQALTADVFTPAATLTVELLVLPFFGVRPGVLARRAVALLPAAAGPALVAAAVLVLLGPVPAAGLLLRVVAVVLPVVVVFATTDPTDLADALTQNAKAPARVALGVLAAFRLVPLLGQEWRTLALTRRARGLGSGSVVVAPPVRSLLSAARRRRARLATAIRARGPGPDGARTRARRQHFTLPDVALLGAALLTSTTVLAVSLSLG